MKVFFINTINTTLGMLVSKTTFLVLILVYIWLGYKTNTELIYYVLNLFNTLNMQFGFSLPINFSRTAQLYASFQRLNKVLQCDELKKSTDTATEKSVVSIENMTFRLGNKTILNGISMNVNYPGLTVVTGPVGSGKSSLLKIILQDYQPISEGKIINDDNDYKNIWLFHQIVHFFMFPQ